MIGIVIRLNRGPVGLKGKNLAEAVTDKKQSKTFSYLVILMTYRIIAAISTILLIVHLGDFSVSAQTPTPSAPECMGKYCISVESTDLSQLPNTLVRARVWNRDTGMPVPAPSQLDYYLRMEDSDAPIQHTRVTAVRTGAVRIEFVLSVNQKQPNQVYDWLKNLVERGFLRSTLETTVTVRRFQAGTKIPPATMADAGTLLNALSDIPLEELNGDKLADVLDAIKSQYENDDPNLTPQQRILKQPRTIIVLVTTNKQDWEQLSEYARDNLVPIYVVLIAEVNTSDDICRPIRETKLECALLQDTDSRLLEQINALGTRYAIEFDLQNFNRGTSKTNGILFVHDKGARQASGQVDVSLAENYKTRPHLALEYWALDLVIMILFFAWTYTSLRLIVFWRKQWSPPKGLLFGLAFAIVLAVSIATIWQTLSASNEPEKAWMGIFMQEVIETPNPTEQPTKVQEATLVPTLIPPSRTPTLTPTPSPTITLTNTPAQPPFQVLAVSPRVAPDFADKCPQMFSFGGEIQVNREGTIKYRWELDNGVMGPIQELTFANSRIERVEPFDVPLGRPGFTGTVRATLRILEPDNASTAPVAVNLRCQPLPPPVPQPPNYPESQRCVAGEREITEPRDGSILDPAPPVLVVQGIAALITGVHEKYELDVLGPGDGLAHVRTGDQAVPNRNNLNELGRIELYRANEKDKTKRWLEPGWYTLRLRLIEKANWPGGSCFSRFYLPEHR